MTSMWSVDIGDGAKRDLAKLDAQIRERVLVKLKWFGENFDILKPEPLHHNFRGEDKLKVGDWRVVYEIKYEYRIIFVRYVEHRSEVYKRKK